MLNKFLVLQVFNTLTTIFSVIVLSLLVQWTLITERVPLLSHPFDLLITISCAVVSALFSIGNLIPIIMRRLGYSKLVYVTQRTLAGSWFLACLSMTVLVNRGGLLDINMDLTIVKSGDTEKSQQAHHLATIVRALAFLIGIIYVGASCIVYKISVGRGVSNFTRLEKFIRNSQYFLRNSEFLRNSQFIRNSKYTPSTTANPQTSEVIIRVPDPVFTKEVHKEDKQVFACALYDYDGNDEVDLRFKVGEVIKVTKYSRNHDEWWEGELHGRHGEFPGTYVKLVN